MPPFRVEYLCSYRPIWRWDGQETDDIREAIAEAFTLAAQGRTVRLMDARNVILWPR